MGNIMHCHSPLGDITVVSDQTGDALIGLWFDGQRGFDNTLSERVSPRPFPILREAERWLDIYFSGRKPESMPRLSPVGSPFRLAVWRILLDIPWGQVVTYGDIARRLEAERGGRRCRRAQPHIVDDSLPSRHRHRRQSGRLCWRFAAQALSAGAGGRRCIRIARPPQLACHETGAQQYP